jgi:hypothetical protein
MSLLKALGLVRRAETAVEPEKPESELAGRPAEQDRVEEGRAVFQEATLLLEDYYRVRVVITNVGPRRARVSYSARMDLPFRVRLVAPTLKLKCWARVVWQDEGAAELEFQPDEDTRF